MLATLSLNFSPPVIAHRGASAYAPENTMIAFTKAAQLGAKWIEFDVMLAACGTPIIFHDDLLDRTTNGKGEVTQFPYAYLNTLDAGAWFNPIYAGEHIPTLAEVLLFLKNTHMNVNVELKPTAGYEKELVIRVLEIISPYLDHPSFTILFSSFSMEALQHLREYSPNALIGLLLHEWEKGWEKYVESLRCVSLHVNEEIIDRETAQKIKKMDKKLLCYTVNNPKRAKELFSFGVDAVFSDNPDKIC